MLAELLYGQSGKTLTDLNFFIPDIHFPPLRVIKADTHIVKSHFPFSYGLDSSKYKKVIYIIRNPKDVAGSYYRYLGYHGYQGDFSKFLEDWLAGRIWPSSWREHIVSWIGIGSDKIPVDLCLIKYEDLISDTIGQINRVVTFLGIMKDKETIIKAIETASPDNMRKKEQMRIRTREGDPGMKFIGEAKSGSWKNKLTKDQALMIEECLSKEMKEFGYL